MKARTSGIVIGMNLQHDGGCCLLIDGRIGCAVSEERLTRVKGAAGSWNALKYCLEATDITLNQVDLVVFSSYGKTLPVRFDYGLSRLGFPQQKCTSVDHHLSHACSAFLSSPFEEALVLVTDGAGNAADTESYYIGSGNQVRRIGGNIRREAHRGIGKTYEAFTSFLGWPMMECGKTMALAAFGDLERFQDLDLFDVKHDQVNSRLKQRYLDGVLQFAQESQVDFGSPFSLGDTELSRDVAYFVQNRTELALLALVRHLVKTTGLRRLCLGGGVALNCLVNRRLLDESGIDDIFIVPAASDKGQCLGNALYGYHVLKDGPRTPFQACDYRGREYCDDEVKLSLELRQELGNNFIVRGAPIQFEYHKDIVPVAARLLSQGKIVGWFQGRSELGPRALGARSILCDPRHIDIVNRLNSEVKRRESFRPYAPSVLEEWASEYFDLPCASPFMLLAARVKAGKRGHIPAVVHVDGTARPQTVPAENRGAFRRLLEQFFAITDLPILLNTSFNLPGEPIVESPTDALSGFLRTKMDYLAIGNYLVRRVPTPW